MKIYKIYKSILVWGMLLSLCSVRAADEVPVVLYDVQGVPLEVEYDDREGKSDRIWLHYEGDDGLDYLLIGNFVNRESVTGANVKTVYRHMPFENNQRTDLFYFTQSRVYATPHNSPFLIGLDDNSDQDDASDYEG